MDVIAYGRCNFQTSDPRGRLPLLCPCDRGEFSDEAADCAKCSHERSFHRESFLDTDGVALLKLVQAPPYTLSLRDTITPRTETCRRILELAIEKRVVLARGTPTIGKTTLARRFTNYTNSQHLEGGKHNAVYIDAGYKDEFERQKGRSFTTEEYIQVYMNDRELFRSHLKGIRYRDDLIVVIDEAQLTYSDYLFWTSLKEQTTHYLLFSSYGSPGLYPINSVEIVTPWIMLNPSQRIGFRHKTDTMTERISLFFTESEHRDAIKKWQKQTQEIDPRFSLAEDTVCYIYDLTGGHPGITTAALHLLHKEWKKHKVNSGPSIPIDRNYACKFLEDNEIVSKHFSEHQDSARNMLNWDSLIAETIPYKPASLKPEEWKKAIRKRLENILFNGQAEELNKNDDAYCSSRAIYLCGLVQAELAELNNTITVHVFPSLIHKRHYEYILQKETAYPSDIANPLQLLTRAIPLFSSFVLENPKDKERGYAPGARPRRQDYLEALYCDELYRCLFTVLDGGHMQSEWSGPDSTKRIDFRVRISETVAVGIKCLRNGDQIQTHIERCLDGGDYWPYIQNGYLQQYAIVDFRTERAGYKPDFSKWAIYDFVYHVVFYPQKLGRLAEVQIYHRGACVATSYCQP